MHSHYLFNVKLPGMPLCSDCLCPWLRTCLIDIFPRVSLRRFRSLDLGTHATSRLQLVCLSAIASSEGCQFRRVSNLPLQVPPCCLCVLRADDTRAALVHEVQLAAPVVNPALRGAPNRLRMRCCALVRQSTLL